MRHRRDTVPSFALFGLFATCRPACWAQKCGRCVYSVVTSYCTPGHCYRTVHYCTVLCGSRKRWTERYEYIVFLAQSYEHIRVAQCIRRLSHVPSIINSQVNNPRVLPIVINQIVETSKSWPVLLLADHGMKHAMGKDNRNTDNHLIM